MRLVSAYTVFVALMAMLLPTAYAAPTSQAVDARAVLDASARAMDAAQSMRFSGAMDMSVPMADGPKAMNIPMSGTYQAPDRMQMQMQLPDMGTSMEMIMVGGQVWTRKGQGAWQPMAADHDAYASPVGMSHSDWFGGFLDPVATDIGNAYRITAELDMSAALGVGYAGPLEPSTAGSSVDASAVPAEVTLTIDKASSYMTSMRMDLAMPTPDRSTIISMTMLMSFTDFNGVAGEILPPV
jgi:hypothetical protein